MSAWVHYSGRITCILEFGLIAKTRCGIRPSFLTGEKKIRKEGKQSCGPGRGYTPALAETRVCVCPPEVMSDAAMELSPLWDLPPAPGTQLLGNAYQMESAIISIPKGLGIIRTRPFNTHASAIPKQRNVHTRRDLRYSWGLFTGHFLPLDTSSLSLSLSPLWLVLIPFKSYAIRLYSL